MAEQDTELRRRKYPRVKEACVVKYRVVETPDKQPDDQGGAVVNISGGGMCFSVDEELAPGVVIALEMSLSELPTPVVSLARIIWCDAGEQAAKFDVGVEFCWIGWADAEAQNRMLRYIHERLDELGIDSGGEAP